LNVGEVSLIIKNLHKRGLKKLNAKMG